ncbi:hypothetical protein LUZ60_015199 [Juncus effusus]|nr:hypothetical protein LUZ60_015199 [Juncus effusus]
MAPIISPYSLCFQSNTSNINENIETDAETERFIANLPNVRLLYKYEGFWFPHPNGLLGVMSCRKNFVAQPTDIVVATVPKVGTTWLKALTFAALNQPNVLPDLSLLPSPRLLGTHLPYTLLPHSVEESGCKIVYICRNPRDTFVSMWHFFKQYLPQGTTIEQYFESFFAGVHLAGPFLDHVLSYWQVSQKYPDRVMFMRYEELKKDTKKEFMRLAEFMGCKFSEEEIEGKVVEKLMEMCSLGEMKGLEVNKTGETLMGDQGMDNKAFFRLGEVGDWKNHLSPEMVERLNKMTEEKLSGSGLSFQEYYAKSA